MTRSKRRCSTQQPKYKEQSDDEDEDEAKLRAALGEGETSGSDFEEDIRKAKKKPVESSSSDQEDKVEEEVKEDETIEEDEEVEEKVDKAKPSSKLAQLKRRQKSLEKGGSFKRFAFQANFASRPPPLASEGAMEGNGLNLSEESSSEDEAKGPVKDVKSKPKKTSKGRRALPKEAPIKSILTPVKPDSCILPPEGLPAVKEEQGEDDEMVMASQLEELAAAYTQISETVATKKQTAKRSNSDDDEDESSPSKKYRQEISDLLREHEVPGSSLSSSDGEGASDNEDDGKPEPALEEKTITVEVPTEISGRGRGKKKAFDMEAWLKRELGRAEREAQLLAHKAHFVVMVAHLKFVNDCLGGSYGSGAEATQTLLALALSVVPPAHMTAATGKNTPLTVVRLAAFANWFREAFPVAKLGSSLGDMRLFEGGDIVQVLRTTILNFTCLRPEHLVFVFVLAARSMGWNTRIVLDMNLVPQKPDNKKPANLQQPQPGSSKDSESPKPSANSKSDKVKKSKDSESPKASSSSKAGDDKVKKDTESPAKSKSSSRGKKTEVPSSKDIKRSAKTKEEKSESHSKSSKETDKRQSRSSRSKDTKSEACAKSSDTTRDKKGSSRSHSSKALSAKALKEAKSRSVSPVKRPKDSSDSSDDFEPSPKGRQKKKGSQSRERKTEAKSSTESERRNRGRSKDTRSERSSQKSSEKTSSKSSDEKDWDKSSKASKSVSPVKSSKDGSSNDSKDKGVKRPPLHYWAEVWVDSDWVTVDVVSGKVGCHGEMEGRFYSVPGSKKPVSIPAGKQMLYVIGANVDGSLKDVTKRYTQAKFDTVTRKARVSQDWVAATLAPFQPQPGSVLAKIHAREDQRLDKSMAAAPMPTAVGAFKNHPLYALQRHLLKFEAIYPPDAPTLGFIRGEGVYARECVHTLQSRVTWLKEGRAVRIGQEPYKVVTARPKWDRMSGTMVKDQPLEVFGQWQTELYVPPPAKDGKVPRNEYGNVELFKPWMLPKGTVHIPIQDKILNKTARKLDIDCAPAMIGWEFSGGGCHPVFDGFVVCSEHQEILMDAWNTEVEEKAKRDAAKKEKRVLDNWRKLAKGLLTAEKIKRKYAKN